jgi:hypothetical protein
MLGGTGDSVELKRTWRKGFCNGGAFTKYLLGSLNRETQRMNSMQMFQMVSLSGEAQSQDQTVQTCLSISVHLIVDLLSSTFFLLFL